jgi:hypothetical protein
MAAPEYVPVPLADKPREGEPIPPARRWTPSRPADLKAGQPIGRMLGRPGPDQGYALQLVRRFDDRLAVGSHDEHEDAVAGCVAVALTRASLFGRAPVITDLELAFTVWGYLREVEPPAELVAFRKALFEGARHDYTAQRAIVDRVPETTLRLTPAAVRDRLGDWRDLLRT